MLITTIKYLLFAAVVTKTEKIYDLMMNLARDYKWGKWICCFFLLMLSSFFAFADLDNNVYVRFYMIKNMYFNKSKGSHDSSVCFSGFLLELFIVCA